MGQGCGGHSVAPDAVFSVSHAGFSIAVRTHRRMGWKKDLPDFRDKHLALPAAARANLPAAMDLRPKEGFPVYDQGELGSCTANAIGACMHLSILKQGLTDMTPSRLFIYYNERAMEGSVDDDAGAYIRDGIKVCTQIGVCDEDKQWPYVESKFKTKPSDECYSAAAKYRSKEYARVPQTLEDMKACINQGYPFCFGFTVYSGFMSAKVASTGQMTMPTRSEYVCGGHAVQACGYDDSKKAFVVRNSWGVAWGEKGHFYMPYEYICNPHLASDFWVIRVLDGAPLPTS